MGKMADQSLRVEIRMGRRRRTYFVYSEGDGSPAWMAIRPSPEVLSRFILVVRVDSRSEAVIISSLSCNLNKKLSRMGNVFLVLITLLMACR